MIGLVVWEYDLRRKGADIVRHDAERRRYPRIKAKIPLEILCSSAAPMRTATDEISACGCYIETMFTIDVGTKVDLALSVNDERIQIKGVVVTKYPQVGNGIDFVDIAPENRVKLTKFISESNSQAAIMPVGYAQFCLGTEFECNRLIYSNYQSTSAIGRQCLQDKRMIVLIVLFGSWLILRGVGAFGVTTLATWHDSIPYALAIMFIFTGVAHFNKMRHDLAQMIPSFLPQPMFIVYVTGACEFLGAAGLLISGFRAVAGICLILLLLGMFTANVNAASKGMTLRAKPVTPLWLRTPMQILFIGLIWWATQKPSLV